jgi:4-amino-4-deoxy-L-arabinose transferase-like glycosyltransferase
VSEKAKGLRIPLGSSRIWLILIILLGSAVRLYRLGYQSLWFDESLSMALASAPLKISIEATLAEGLQHLPLYYLLLRIFVWIGRSEMVLRLPSAVCGVLAIPLIYQVGRRCLKQGTGLFAALLLAVNPYHVWFSQEARMYSLLMLSTLGALYFFLRLLRENRRSLWLGFIVFHAIGCCTLYFAFFIPPDRVHFYSLHLACQLHHPAPLDPGSVRGRFDPESLDSRHLSVRLSELWHRLDTPPPVIRATANLVEL